MREIPKVWGKEKIIVNNDEYCGKLLCLDKGATSSLHYHKTKQETFYALEGQVALTIDGKEYILNSYSKPRTILPNQKHSFFGISDSIIVEISTHHDDKDVVRLSKSIAGNPDNEWSD